MPEDNSSQSHTDTGPEGHGEAIPVAGRKAEKEPCSRNCCEETYFSHKTKDFISLFTLIAVSVYTGITILLWCNSNKQIIISADTEKRDLRAYVYPVITAPRYSPGNSPWDRFAVSLTITNNGKTWARNLRIRDDFVTNPTGDPFDAARLNSKVSAPLLLGPAQHVDVQFGNIMRKDLPQIIRDKTQYFYTVWLTYQDVLSDPPVTWQTEVSMGTAFDMEGDGHMTLGYSITHNCADSDCHD